MDKLILVNKNNLLDDSYEVDLMSYQDVLVAKEIIPDLDLMFKDMQKLGLKPIIVSGYRTKERQTFLYNRKVNYYLDKGYNEIEAKNLASKWVAKPSTSEHQTGLALDIVDESYQQLETDQEKTKVNQWLKNNAYQYGFILRYPLDKENITFVNYEPWHYRYVGKKAALDITKNHITLEEYLIDK